MTTVFLGDGGTIALDQTAMGMSRKHTDNNYIKGTSSHIVDVWLEFWDYVGGCSFRGFLGGLEDQKSLFAFFDSSVVGRDLKQG